MKRTVTSSKIIDFTGLNIVGNILDNMQTKLNNM